MNNLYLVLAIVLVGGITATTATFAQSDLSIPEWVRNTAVWWGQGDIGDSEFVNLLQFLIDRDIIIVPTTTTTTDNQSQIQELEDKIEQLQSSNAVSIKDAYDRGYTDGKNAASSYTSSSSSSSLPPSHTTDSSTLGIVHGIVTKHIDGNTIDISGERIRSPFVWVEDSGNKTAPHAMYAIELCPIGTAAHYDIDDNQPVGKYGRTIAMVWCEGQTKSLDQLMVESGLGWIKQYYCEKSEFRDLDWVNNCQDSLP